MKPNLFYLCGNVRNKLDGKCYKDVLNQTYILILVSPNKTINICANTTFEQVMVNFSIN